MTRHILVSIAHLIALPGTLLVGVPVLLLSLEPRTAFDPGSARTVGLALMALAFGGALWMGVSFVVSGRGTPNPALPPERLVTGGLYRFVRNPGYVAVAAFMTGEVLWTGSMVLVGYGVVVMLGLHLFVVYYEEPGLRRRFGSDYRAYCDVVPRWIPRLVS